MRSPGSGRSALLTALLAAALLAAGCSGGGGSGGCIQPLFDCLQASGDCLVANDDQTNRTTLTWDSGAHLEGAVGLLSFQAFGPGGQLCFEKQVNAGVISLLADGKTYQVERRLDGSVLVTCPDGSQEEYPSGSPTAGQPGIDPERLIGCRQAGLCSQDADCGAGNRCCQGTCHTGALCPGECTSDADCGDGLRCCEGRCNSTPICNVPCFDDGDCEDGVFCNGTARCQGFRCTVAEPVDCDDQIDCTVDACDEAGRSCTHTPQDALCEAGQICFPQEGGCQTVTRCTGDGDCTTEDVCLTPACDGGICRFTPIPGCCNADGDCADGLPCNGDERCQDHACQAGVAPTCDDGVDCTTDLCDDAAGGCASRPDNTRCTAPQVCDTTQGCIDAPACSDDEFEENDLQAQAGVLLNQSPAIVRLCPGDSADWFTITVPPERDLAVVVTWMAGSPAPILQPSSMPIWPISEPTEAQGKNMHTFILEDFAMETDFWLQVVNPTDQEYAYIVIAAYDE